MAVVLGLGSAALAVDTETVPVGNVGNIADTRYGTPGYGAVGYEYNIGKYEVTAGQYCEFLNNVAGVDTYGLYNTGMAGTVYGSGIARTGGGIEGAPYAYTVDSAFVSRPVNYVSWGDAARFANWVTNGQPTGLQGDSTTEDGVYHLNGATSDGYLLAVSVPAASQRAAWAGGSKRYVLLTSEDEWYKAAYYDPSLNSGAGGYYDYPTGSNTSPGRDMSETTNPENNANYTGAPYPIDSPYYTTVAGEFELSDSPYGTFDQGGNVWEWNERISGSGRGLRGGSFSDGDGALHALPQAIHDPSYERHNIGFRVSKVPEPATMSLLTLGGLSLLRRRQRGIANNLNGERVGL